MYHEIREKYALPLPVIAGNVDKRFEPAYFKAEPVFDFFLIASDIFSIFAALKRFSAILFLSVTLLTQTELHQVFKLPVLLHHFAEHKAQNKDMSIGGFIILHYFSGNPKDKDYDRDMQLPFKTTDCAAMVNVAIIPSPSNIVKLPAYFIDITYPSLANSRERFSHTADIWQPPRLS